MDNFFSGLTYYNTEECSICEEGIIEVKLEDSVIDNLIITEQCPCCLGKGFLYIHNKEV